ncbi:hypothetical protein [Leekyejoonella antrihumi]|uniref:hypothetical protein n=1 Tax=Leekyejoonella antrihumi TaxID=1660198 RepID=UPI001644F769|nr:hypothetical protein [Leekyejoonella antrihumi]
MHHSTKGDRQPRGTNHVAVRATPAQALTVAEARAPAILDACEHLRDRFLFARLLDTRW